MTGKAQMLDMLAQVGTNLCVVSSLAGVPKRWSSGED